MTSTGPTSTSPVPSVAGALERDPQPGHPAARSGYAGGLAIALLSAASFGLSGSLARSLLDLGWTPAAVVAVRITGAFVLLLVPCLVLLRRTGLPSLRQTGRMAVYGVVAVALAQLCYFSAVQYLSVGVALLLEYLAPVLLIFWHWARSGRRPAGSVFGGAALALLGLVFVLDLRSGVTLDPVGVAWGLGAAVCLCAYFVLSETGGRHGTVPPLLLTTVGTGVGGAVILAAAGIGLLPLAARTGSTVLAGAEVGWWLPVVLLVGVTAVLAYLTGIVAVRRLGSSVASFVSLAEVLFAVAFAVVLLAQQPSPGQLVGGALVLAGIGVVQRGARP
ncbi:Threonine/homoserine efflux transporter RhtA [Friedmanniella luteola]|uniref:Threonine/homoserine efflux transporter RhtA n=1 Tax=Friedmanniella luteola TaxID=546871 RepID=A0A1H2A0X0_9ACTN|nr:EamA family transporter [Friedmanniella luteola]SDT39499.1 Threonine/homoserine efflux transporter RhtA [Friedmanniella luteola]